MPLIARWMTISARTGFGDLRRNIYRGPFQQNWDVSLLKHFGSGSARIFDLRLTFSTFGTMRTSPTPR